MKVYILYDVDDEIVDVYDNLFKAYEKVAKDEEENVDADDLEYVFINCFGYDTVEEGLNAIRTEGKHIEEFCYYIREYEVK